ncbi:asparagine synthase (glutamine-hydrolyzing) [Xylanimonas ulmi]|uniref:asparagine synthase (glutamine-hydrolyzing) n=1 Tax=Xylanimonas ulmi TaxID=228973 RepID=A0A4Q7M1W7_9MICO|nr:asparagine synthase (glutamine-hydrolyzing) [Xylanibacterium ulmi]RZS61846.1 asparagine synthase (glutamine-hydrolysing) [Xylanibacterium ulmi]
MCGICGVRSPSAAPDAALVQRMMAALHHRGPDACGWFRDDQVALGHTRLAIVDVEGGAQPMSDEDEQVWVTFNGEIFNHVELAAQLRDRGRRLRTRSDTEVIVQAWKEWGTECFERFNGQWALAIWDRRTGELVLSRDRFGVRPLFYASVGERLLFASEVKAIFADPQVRRAFDPTGLDQAMTLWSPVAPRTVFDGVRQVPPGTYLVVRGGAAHEHRYWEPTFPEHGQASRQDVRAHAQELRERIVRATRLRFERSDVPVGAYLSGGLDSAVTAAAITAYTDAELHTFSLRFADVEFDEGRYQRMMSDRLATTHREVVVTEREIADVFPDVVWHAENVLLRTAPAPMLLLSRLVRESGYKVVVTGEGSDEVLAGYDIFREARLREQWARDPDAVDRVRAVEQLYPWMRRSPALAPAFAARFFGKDLDVNDLAMSHRPRWGATSALTSMLTAEARFGVDGAADAAVLARMPAQAAGWDPLSRAQWLEMATLLPGYILASQGDRMLMANSVEGRFPFLDADVAAFAGALPADQLIRGMDEKHLLKRAFADLVPPQIIARPKQPYRAPDAASFFSHGAPPWLEEALSPEAVKAAGVFQPVVVERLLAKCRKTLGRGMSNTDNMRLVAVVSVQLLHQLFIDGGRHLPAAPASPMAVFDRMTPTKEP